MVDVLVVVFELSSLLFSTVTAAAATAAVAAATVPTVKPPAAAPVAAVPAAPAEVAPAEPVAVPDAVPDAEPEAVEPDEVVVVLSLSCANAGAHTNKEVNANEMNVFIGDSFTLGVIKLSQKRLNG